MPNIVLMFFIYMLFTLSSSRAYKMIIAMYYTILSYIISSAHFRVCQHLPRFDYYQAATFHARDTSFPKKAAVPRLNITLFCRACARLQNQMLQPCGYATITYIICYMLRYATDLISGMMTIIHNISRRYAFTFRCSHGFNTLFTLL